MSNPVIPTTSAASAQAILARPARIGFALLVVVFGVFGIWAAVAPLEEAAHAPGRVTVASYSKPVQHLEGGIVAAILVGNGDRVAAGQPLLRLEETQSLAQLGMHRVQYVALRVKEARLIAERDGLQAITYPTELSAETPETSKEMAAQQRIFATRRAARQASAEILEQRVGQLRSKIAGLEALRQAKAQLAASYAEELEDTRALLGQGFADKTHVRELERALAAHTGEGADLQAQIATAEVQIGETRLERIRLEQTFQSEVAGDLAEAQTAINNVAERIRALEDVVARTTVRAPVAGIVNGMQVHTVGGVIAPGTRILDIVPEHDDLIVEARIAPNDIDRVALNQEVTIRFSEFGRQAPRTSGRVVHVSADSYLDEVTKHPYYLARIGVTPEGMKGLEGFQLVPGMPAEVFIATGSRTFLQYLFKPITNVLARSFIED
ncbi:MAG: HlyD family type I secretion periplasmic adaptor subunit [Candidatus Latescibacteria bacterium]|nr:HlyD family type I secretion periplasmic adaptor subunit [Candidatus Latescibacterota bacterium]